MCLLIHISRLVRLSPSCPFSTPVFEKFENEFGEGLALRDLGGSWRPGCRGGGGEEWEKLYDKQKKFK